MFFWLHNMQAGVLPRQNGHIAGSSTELTMATSAEDDLESGELLARRAFASSTSGSGEAVVSDIKSGDSGDTAIEMNELRPRSRNSVSSSRDNRHETVMCFIIRLRVFVLLGA